MKHFQLFLCRLLFIVCLFPHVCRGQSEPEISWHQLETRHTLIQYQHPQNLKLFYKRIDFSPKKWSLSDLFSKPADNDPLERIKTKVDGLYERVQEILDMRKKMEKPVIRIYSCEQDLQKAYRDIYKSNRSLRAWYIFEVNTIYLNVRDLHEGILAHELAHSIIDHYLSVRPPAASSEILARYVDSHLFE